MQLFRGGELRMYKIKNSFVVLCCWVAGTNKNITQKKGEK